RTPLWLATEGDHKAVVKLLLETEKVEVNAKDWYRSMTPLSLAAKGGDETVVKLLLEIGKVDVATKDSNGLTPLWLAANGGHEAVVKLLFETGKAEVVAKAKMFIDSTCRSRLTDRYSPDLCPRYRRLDRQDLL
ncbi:ankyrin, partial [Delitschia confertaspora ATCC 74209]